MGVLSLSQILNDWFFFALIIFAVGFEIGSIVTRHEGKSNGNNRR